MRVNSGPRKLHFPASHPMARLWQIEPSCECRLLATSGGSVHALATPELPPRTDIQIRTSAFLDFRRLYPQQPTWQAAFRYPDSGYELSREIAAFASSNAGTILIGVSDDGDLKGLPGLDTNTGRDTLLRRVEGVCSGNIRPAITPVVKFAQEPRCSVAWLSFSRCFLEY